MATNPYYTTPVDSQAGKLLVAPFGSLAMPDTAIFVSILALALRLFVAVVFLLAKGNGAVQIALTACQNGIKDDGRDA